MKSHLTSLLQRKRVEIESIHDTRRISKSQGVADIASLETRDGYDWLHQIKRAQATRIAAR
ncbi:hypothetical protein EAH75_04200 [Rhodanobacter glycinis]|nr:hypothetical protein EAH75_04200 [Rhodanobacter glycinis]